MEWFSEIVDRIRQFFWMGGYAFYIWSSYLFALLAIGGEVLFLLRRKKFCQTRMENIPAKVRIDK